MRWTEDRVLDAVEAHYMSLGPCVMLRQVAVADRRLDALIISERGLRIAVEAKTSRADFRRESDAKRVPAWRVANRCVYAAPSASIIQMAEVPDGWGLLHVFEGGASQAVRPTDHVHDRALDRDLITMLLWRAAQVERKDRAPGDPVALASEVDRLLGLLANRDTALAREKARAQDAAEQVLAALGEQVCDTCDGAITYTRVGAWRHLDKALDASCEARRAEAEKCRRKAATGAEYGSIVAPRVMPRHLSTGR